MKKMHNYMLTVCQSACVPRPSAASANGKRDSWCNLQTYQWSCSQPCPHSV